MRVDVEIFYLPSILASFFSVTWLANGLLRIIIIGADCQIVLCKLEGFVPLVLIFVN